MRILFITHAEPIAPFFGGNIRSKALLEALMERYEVTLVTFYRTGDQKTELHESFGGAVLFWHDKNRFRRAVNSVGSLFSRYPGVVRSYYNEEIIRNLKAAINTFDLVFFDTCFHPIDELEVHVPFVVSNNNVESRVFGEIASNSVFKVFDLKEFFNKDSSFQFPLIDRIKTERLERRINQRARLSLCVSEIDQTYFKELNPNTRVIENGAYISEHVPRKNGEGIMFMGSFAYKPNRDSFAYFMREIYPLVSGLPLEVVGIGLKAIKQRNVRIHGYVEDLDQIYARCGVFVVPLLSGGGTRLKILEALANRIPVVTTSKGIEGLALEHREHVLIADKPEDFASGIREALTDSLLAERLTQNGYEYAREYSWEVIGQKLLNAVSDIVEL